MAVIDLIRHAKTQWNLEKKLQGRNDIPLCSFGKEQARAWAKMLARKDYSYIVSSPMKRATQTAQIISDVMGRKIYIEPDFKEQDFGAWEGKQIQELRKQFPGKVEEQEKRGWDFCPPEGESRIQVLKRILPAFHDVCQTAGDKQILVVAHASVIRSLIYKVLNREHLPTEKKILKKDHLHTLIWESKDIVRVKKLNSVSLVYESTGS